MERAILLCCLILITLLPTNAQTFDWAHRFGDPLSAGSLYSVPDMVTDVERMTSGDYAVTGYFMNEVDIDPSPAVFIIQNSTFHPIYFLARYTSGGMLVWVKTIDMQSNFGDRRLILDAADNIYLAGAFQGTADFDPGVGVTNLSSNGIWDDIFLAKYDANGDFQWVVNMGGADIDDAPRVGIDGNGDIILAGNFQLTMDMDPSAATFPVTSHGLEDIFLARFSPGGQFLAGTSLGGPGHDELYDLKIKNNQVLICGSFTGTTALDPANSGNTVASYGGYDAFAAWYDPTFTYLNAVHLGGSGGDDIAYTILENPAGEIFLSGNYFQQMDLDPGPGVQTVTATAERDLFLLKLDNAGQYQWGFSTGGGYTADGWDGDLGHNLGIDAAGNIYLLGEYNGSADFDPGTAVQQLSMPGNYQNRVFLASYTDAGLFRWAFPVGGYYFNVAENMHVAPDGAIVITGSFRGTSDFDPGSGVVNLTASAGTNAFIARYTQVITATLEAVPAAGITLAPNPSSDICTVRLAAAFQRTCILRVCDLNGRVLVQESLPEKTTQHTFSVVQWPAGLYIVSVFQEGVLVGTGKLIKTH